MISRVGISSMADRAGGDLVLALSRPGSDVPRAGTMNRCKTVERERPHLIGERTPAIQEALHSPSRAGSHGAMAGQCASQEGTLQNHKPNATQIKRIIATLNNIYKDLDLCFQSDIVAFTGRRALFE
jgi:hypothetical protein